MKRMIAALMALSLIGAFGCTKSEEADSEATVTATAVATTPATRGTIESTMSFEGNLEAQSEVIVTVPQPGKVTSSKVDVGTVVKKGQLLFTMDPKDVAAQKGTTQAQYDAAKASADYTDSMIADVHKQISDATTAKTELNSQIIALIDPISQALTGNPAQSSVVAKLNAGQYSAAVTELKTLVKATPALSNPLFDTLETMTLSHDQLSSAVTQLESSLKTLEGQKIQADGQVNVASAGLEAIDAQISNYSVYAPISGIIGTYDITVGAYPVSQIPLTIVNMDKVKLSVNMLDTQVGKVKVGDSVDVTVDALGGKTVTGKVKTVAPTPNLQTRMYPVVIEIDNPDHEIKPGFFVKVSFGVEQKENTLYIPSAGVLQNDDGTSYVYVNMNGTAKKTDVQLGIEDASGNVEVVSGINEGDLIITSNLSSLRDGAPVFSLEEKGE